MTTPTGLVPLPALTPRRVRDALWYLRAVGRVLVTDLLTLVGICLLALGALPLVLLIAHGSLEAQVWSAHGPGTARSLVVLSGTIGLLVLLGRRARLSVRASHGGVRPGHHQQQEQQQEASAAQRARHEAHHAVVAHHLGASISSATLPPTGGRVTVVGAPPPVTMAICAASLHAGDHDPLASCRLDLEQLQAAAWAHHMTTGCSLEELTSQVARAVRLVLAAHPDQVEQVAAALLHHGRLDQQWFTTHLGEPSHAGLV